MSFDYITQNDGLKAFIRRVESSPYLSLDTEFLRERTYWPELCLIQIACDQGAALIDPLADGLDIDLLRPLLTNSKCLKIIHAGRQDLEIFYHHWDHVLSPVFDTQIAAMVTSLGESISYEKLVESVLNIKLNKTLQYTNWSVRPLSAAHKAYAFSDVAHLNTLRTSLMKRMGDKLSWVNEEMAILMNPDTYRNDPQAAWKKIKMKVMGSSDFWGRVQAIAAWREEWAQKENIPRAHILKDDALLALVTKSHSHRDEWIARNPFIAKDPGILDILRTCKPFVPPPAPITNYDATVFDLLKALLHHQAGLFQVAPRLIAAKDDLVGFLSDPRHSKLRQGWRYEVFGAQAEKLLNGRLALHLDSQQHIRVRDI